MMQLLLSSSDLYWQMGELQDAGALNSADILAQRELHHL